MIQKAKKFIKIYEDKGVKTQLRDIWDILGIEPYQADENFVGELGNVEHFNSNVHSSISRTTVIGTDANGNAHLADELIGKMVILVYTEDDKDVFLWENSMIIIIGMDIV